MVIGIQLAAIYFGAFDVDRISKIQSKKPQRQSGKVKIEKVHHEVENARDEIDSTGKNKRNYWFEPEPIKSYEWGLKNAPEEFDFGDYEEIRRNHDTIKLVSGEPQKGYNDRIKRPPNIIGAGAKKCGTIAFSTFLALNKQVLMAVVLMA